MTSDEGSAGRSLRRGGGVRAPSAPAQIALAWLLAQGEDIAPVPGTRRVADQAERLGSLTPAAGARHDDANMASIDHVR
jgi:aryl-alcohol dehydrogenase-like predicted oxidoreductase